MENTYRRNHQPGNPRPQSPESFTPAHFTLHQQTYAYVDLPTVCGERLQQLPMVLRLLLENAIRNMHGAEREQAVQAIFDWLPTGTSEAEIAFQPGRVLMHDTTSTPALVDIAAMRNALDEAGVDPAVLNPGLPVDVSIDHSLAVEVFAVRDAVTVNLQHEIRRNGERYRFLRWAASVLQGVRIHPPGTGIMHTINLEQLATVVTTQDKQGVTWAVPDMMIGTDSHTPMVNGIGVLGWGVGGLEAQTVMFGMPTMLRIPDVVGVKLVGQLPPAALATDLALTVTQRLRQLGVTGEFVEFYGPGVSTLSAGDRAVVANMAPEYGATTGFFGIDANTLAYLKTTGRTDAAIGLVEAYAQHAGLWFNPQAEPRYTQTLTIDLSAIGLHVAGPRRPQDLWLYSQTPEALADAGFTPSARAGHSASLVQAGQTGHAAQAGHSLEAASAARADGHGRADQLPRHPVAIAAISSCTNTTDPALLVAAGLLARNARALGLRVPAWVKTSLAPGSPAAATYLERAGLLDDLDALGFGIVGYGCTSCIGNTGPLTQPVRDAQRAGQSQGVAILSGNRNFPGRVHPDLELSFIMSPPLVIAFGLCGDAQKKPGRRAAANRAQWPSRVPQRRLAHARRHCRPRGPGCQPRRLRARLCTRQCQPLVARPASTAQPAVSVGRALHHPAPPAVCRRDRRQPTGPLQRLPLAGGGRRRDHRPHLARQCHSARQLGGRLLGGTRRRPPRPERVCLTPWQLGGHAARRLPQQNLGQPVAAGPARGAHPARAQWRGHAHLGRRPTLPRRR